MDKRTYVLRMMMVLLMMMGVSEVWGQVDTDYSGTYYIASNYKTANSNPAVYNYVGTTLANNYYLCPTDWTKWCTYKPDDDFYEKNENSDYPFLTTYKCRTNFYTPGLAYAKWIITKHPTENYYYIKHAADDKYLMLNGQIRTTPNNTNGPNRLRVHLEAVTGDPGDNALFSIIEDGSSTADGLSVIFRPKTKSTYQLTINGGNTDALTGQSGKADGPTGYTNTKGIIGIYGQANDDNKYFYLEDYIKRPEISYSSDNKVTITYPISAKIYYTTDGSDPTDSENTNRTSFTGTSHDVSFTNVAVVKAAAYIDGEYSNIATYVYVHTGSDKPYLLQSVDNTNFYMVAGDLNSSNNPTVNTSSLPQAGMSWHFEDAGIVNGVQCYYVKNTLANGYLRRDNNSFYIQTSKEDKNDYKFAVIPYLNESGTLAGFYLYNIGKAQYVYKGNNNNGVGNGSDGAVNLTGTANQDLARWNLILVANKSFPSPVTLSDNSSATYYTFASSNTPTQLIAPPTGTSTYMKTSSSNNDNQKWYFKDAGTDGWTSYYYILNAMTGEAMYFGKEAASTTIYNALEMGSLPETPTDNYKFALAHTVTDGEYYIVPKPLVQFTKNKYTAVWYVNPTTPLQTQSNRANSLIKWQISKVEDYVAPPYITYDVATNTATISSTYPGATIYYTTDGTEATTSSSNSVTPVAPSPTASISFVLTADITTIRAIVSKGGAGTSSESTYSVALQLTLSDDPADQRPYLIQSQNNAWNSTDFHFYMIPGDDEGEDPNKITKVNTTSLFRPTMEWYFKNAGEVDGVQYYYIVNKGNNKNLCYDTENTTNGIYMDTNSDNSNKFKFSIVESATAGTYNIIPYGLSSGSIFIYKNTDNANANAINLTNNSTTNNSRWRFILPSALDKIAPFQASNASSTSYYKINSVGSNGHYIVPPSGNQINATTSNSSDANVVKTGVWYFEEAQAATGGDWLTYYHIRNAVTGDYLYFTRDKNNDGACLGIRSTIESDSEDRYMFTWARTATQDTYYIIPKLLKDASQNNISSLRKGDNNTTISTQVTRIAGNFAWTFTAETFNCVEPVITYSTEQNGYVIISTTPGAKIYYTIDDNSNTQEWTEYTGAIATPSSPTTIKAIAARSSDHSDKSTVAECPVTQVDTPVFNYSTGNSISITCPTEGAAIYYVINGTIDRTDPTNGTTLYEGPLTNENGIVGKTISAIAVKHGSVSSTVITSETIVLRCATPVIKRGNDNASFTIECSFPTSGVTIKYTTTSGSGTPANPSTGTNYTGEAVPCTFPITISAIAVADGYGNSEIATRTIKEGLAEEDGIYIISSDGDFVTFVDMVNNNGNDEAAAHYKLMADVGASGVEQIATSFTGVFDGGMHTISNLGHALFNTLDDGKVKNVILDNVSISSGINVGAICNEATGDTRIYNCGVLATNSTMATDEDGYTAITSCSSTISGSGYVGGLVGLLDGSSRVINCFSYANVSGGSHVGGIVGYNNVATTATNLKTMVMNCMFYGEVSGGSIAPIYNGEIITNVGENTGVSNFNYFRLEASYVQPTGVTYNCALGAEDRFLQRFEFFRQLLNSHRELAGWWATGTYSSSEMMKWVLEPSQIGSSTPYPILKAPNKYPSVVNIDAENATTQTERNKGGKLGTLTVNIQMGTQGNAPYFKPEGAEITTSQLTLNITDKDPDHFNFNYFKVQLPYYNDVGTKNYNGNRVVTGWKIVSITGGTSGTFSTSTADAPSFNLADRHCTNKDLYSTSGRVFNQGAYWDVPEGVTAITIEPYWARCTYLADAYADVVYNNAMSTSYNVPNVGGGQIYTNNTNYTIAGESQKVYTSSDNARDNLGLSSSHTVYDHAIVLVGNFHRHNGVTSGNNSGHLYTIMSIDQDHDNEPDYSYILRFDARTPIHPVRVDFINIPGLGMAQKSTGGTGSYNFGILQPQGWFESTNTSLFRVTQFEYDAGRDVAVPYIVQGGVFEQWVGGQKTAHKNKITYFHVGGNVWFKEFHRGSHQDNQHTTKHPPVSVTGGDYDEFYLTGLYRGDIASYADNAECYINGGRFGTVAGAAMEGIGTTGGAGDTGNITWQIQNADIDEFYAGGINAAKPVEGNLTTIVEGGYIKQFCGGPKFGDMNTGKTVTTTATGCIFDTFFGAGYGGNSYSRFAPTNQNNVTNINWNNWVSAQYTQSYNSTYGGVSTQFNYQFIPMSDNATNVARLFVEFVKFSLATTRNVTSTLTDCTITGNFYGGGSLGKVAGNVTSILDGCTVKGNVFGAGFSADLPKVKVDYIGFKVEPYYYTALGTYRMGEKYDFNDEVHQPEWYTWAQGSTISIDKTSQILYTTENLSKDNLGSVNGAVTLTLKGDTKVGTEGDETTGNVFGGGDASVVNNPTNPTAASTTVSLQGNTQVLGNVFGGGNKGMVSGTTTVKIEGVGSGD